ncbi:hypothetical protein QAD02_007546 [Eretmocerus hayati]|uniref:Uncharacterized protein n=1 Tax=Eretmocerus hayati TaxID=131215 RepID=A0ACC2N6D0_9HYME|nr:hypothetical protein QAD02_007546 [Eretmocerus hayati]
MEYARKMVLVPEDMVKSNNIHPIKSSQAQQESAPDLPKSVQTPGNVSSRLDNDIDSVVTPSNLAGPNGLTDTTHSEDKNGGGCDNEDCSEVFKETADATLEYSTPNPEKKKSLLGLL